MGWEYSTHGEVNVHVQRFDRSVSEEETSRET